MSMSLSVDTGQAIKIGHDAGWILSFHQEERAGVKEDPALEISRDDYYAEIHAVLPGSLEGGTYSIVVEGLTDDDYKAIALTQANPPRVMRLYLYYRDLELPDFGILTNVLGSDLINAGTAGRSKIEKHAADLVAELRVQSITRRAGARRYEATITARELAFDLVQTRRPCGEPIDVTNTRAAVAELMRRAWPYPEGSVPFEYYAPTPRTTPPPDTPSPPADALEHVDQRQTIATALQKIAGDLERHANRYGRGMLLIRDGKLHVGQRTAPLDPSAPQPKALTVSQGLLETETLGPMETDPNWDPCDHDGDPAPTRAQFKLTMRGRQDLKPGDLVVFDAPPADVSDTKGPLGGALGALGDLGAGMIEGVSSLFGSDGMKNPVQLYVTTVEHRLGRAIGFQSVVTGVQVGAKDPPQADDLWDSHTANSDRGAAASAPGPARATVEDEAADAVVRLIRREATLLSSTDIAEVRTFRSASSGAEAGQTTDLFRGLDPAEGPAQSRRTDVHRPSDARASGVPYLTPFAWGKCGLVLPRYPGMRVAVSHRHLQASDPLDVGALWQTGHGPEHAQNGDWWLSLPADSPTGNAPAEDRRGAPQDYAGKATHDLIDAAGTRVIAVGSLVVRIGHDQLPAAGTRPSNPEEADSVTIEHAYGSGKTARIQIKSDGSIVIQGKTIEIRSDGDLTLAGANVKVE